MSDNVSPPGGRAPRQAQVVGGLLKCGNCGAGISRGESPQARSTVVCAFCGAEVIVPESLRKRQREEPAGPAAPETALGGPIRWDADGGPTPPLIPPKPKKMGKLGCLLMILFFGTGPVIGIGAALFGWFKEKGMLGPETIGNAVKHVPKSVVAPSMENADASATARNIFDAVRGSWKPGAVLHRVYMAKVRSDGTVDLKRKDAGQLSVTLYDPSAFTGVAPGEDKVPGGSFIVVVMDNRITAVVSDASSIDISAVQNKDYTESFPGCDAKTLWSNAKKAGYPANGIATITFPSYAFHLPHSIAEKLREEKGGVEEYVNFYIRGYESADLPSRFAVEDCTPLNYDGTPAAGYPSPDRKTLH